MRKPKARDLDLASAERIVGATYGFGQRLYPLSPRERFIVLSSLCSMFLVVGDDESLPCARRIGKAAEVKR